MNWTFKGTSLITKNANLLRVIHLWRAWATGAGIFTVYGWIRCWSLSLLALLNLVELKSKWQLLCHRALQRKNVFSIPLSIFNQDRLLWIGVHPSSLNCWMFLASSCNQLQHQTSLSLQGSVVLHPYSLDTEHKDSSLSWCLTPGSSLGCKFNTKLPEMFFLPIDAFMLLVWVI